MLDNDQTLFECCQIDAPELREDVLRVRMRFKHSDKCLSSGLSGKQNKIMLRIFDHEQGFLTRLLKLGINKLHQSDRNLSENIGFLRVPKVKLHRYVPYLFQLHSKLSLLDRDDLLRLNIGYNAVLCHFGVTCTLILIQDPTHRLILFLLF